MTAGEHSSAPGDSGLMALAVALAVLEYPSDLGQLQHEAGLGSDLAGAADLVRLARARGLKAAEKRVRSKDLEDVPCPALVPMLDGRWVVLGRVMSDRVLLQDPQVGRPQEIARAEFEANWSGSLLLLARSEEIAGEERAFDFTWFIPPLIKHRQILFQVTLASLIVQTFGLATPLFVMLVMDKVLVSGGVSTLDVLVLGLISVGLFELALSALRQFLFSHTTNRIDVELKARLFRHLARLPVSYFETRAVGATAQRVAELEQIRSFLTGPALTSAIDLLFTVVFLAVMYHYAPSLTWIVVAFVAVFILIYAVVTPVLRARLSKKSSGSVDNHAFLVENVAGIETLKSLAVEPQMQRRWEDQIASHSSEAFKAERLSTMTQQTVTFLNRLMTAMILWIGAKGVISGDLTAGQLMAMNMLAGRVTAPAQRLAQLWQQVQQTGLAVKRLGEILNQRPEPARTQASSLPDLKGAVLFRDVSFRYRPDGPQILSHISFDVAAGARIGIVGASGSGKSTLVKLMQRLHVPESGKILIDGVDIALIDPAWLRRKVGLVLQENFLFNRSVRENIALADPSLPMDRIQEAAELAGAHEFILTLPEAYDTPVGERGAALSGGQRQRIALARALVTDPRILILDEATSALDYESERIIHRNMQKIAAGRTVFVIAHRLAAVRDCDRILVIEHGRVVEEGSHGELMGREGGRYRHLYEIQQGERDVAPREEAAE
ncbi:type I secretion system permease/ATPase [Nisaea acidiphila]|uniref:Type I secretion system permease/ATPase n=1 Tax=Nisaea acidiphila TaxID=1862145 RepID=A0A9J7AW99_9PROT|nr:type I secretion system permease/ATPase [Nisaea acidiphila]UUX51074.1 type I secretion system permease/ATPase [Nisaea acidiphila]